MRYGILSVLAVVMTAPGWARAQMPYRPAPGYPMAMPGYPMGPGMPMPASPYVQPPLPGPMPPPMVYGPLMPAPYPMFAAPPSSKIAAPPGTLPPRKQPAASDDDRPRREGLRREGLQGLFVKRPKAPPKSEPADFEPIPGRPLWSDDLPPEAHAAPLPEPHFPDRGPRGRCFYGQAEYLFFWVRNQRVPVLLTGQPSGGGLEQPLVGGNGGLDIDNAERQGFRLTQGVWLDRHQSFGLEGSFLMFGERRPDFSTFSPGNVILRRPFLNPTTGVTDSLVVAEPGRPGGFDLTTASRLYTADVNFRCELLRARWFHTDALLGFRFLQLEDELTMRSFTEVLNVSFTDRFATDNTFYGAQIGFETEVHWGCWFFDFWGKLALGNNHQQVEIFGNTANNISGIVTPGALFAQPSNLGTRDQNEFAVLPELGFNFGWKVLDHLRLTLGYSVLYLSRTARPGEYLDAVIDRSQATAVPPFSFRSTGYFAQAINAGLEVRY